MVLKKRSTSVIAALLVSLAAPLAAAQEDISLKNAHKAVRMQQFDQAFKLYSAAANAGNAEAQNQLANMLLNGKGTAQNEGAAILWLEKAVAQSHPGAQYTLSQLLKDKPNEAERLLNASAEQGYTSAKTQLSRAPSQASNHTATSFEIQWFAAARKNQQAILDQLLTDDSQLNTVDSAGRNALFYAAEFNSGAAVSWLITKGIDVNHRDKHGLTALQTALERNHTSIFKTLLSKSDTSQTFSNGDNLLHLAIRLKRYPLINDLLQAGVKINHINKDGWTPLDLADFQNAAQTVASLKRKGAKTGQSWKKESLSQDVATIAKQLEEGSRLSPAAMAVINSNGNLLTQILRKQPDLVNEPLQNESTLLVLATKQNKPKMIKILLDHGANINHSAYKGVSALHVAVRLGYSDVIIDLLKAGASPTQIDNSDRDAISHALTEKRLDIANLLIDYIVDGNTDSDEIRSQLKINSIPINKYILLAIQHESDDIAERLLPYASKTATLDKQKRNALWYAAKNSKPKLIDKLLKSGMSATDVDSLGRTPLMIAVEESCLECAKKLQAASNLDHKTNYGNTPLILATIIEDTQMAAWLLQNKVDVDARNQRGDTALMVAVNANSLKVAKQLIEAKANPDRKNKLGFSAMDLAENAGPEMVKLLEGNSVFGVF